MGRLSILVCLFIFVVSGCNHGARQGQPEEHLTDKGVYPDQPDPEDIPEHDLGEGEKDHADYYDNQNSVFKPGKKREWTLFFFHYCSSPHVLDSRGESVGIIPCSSISVFICRKGFPVFFNILPQFYEALTGELFIEQLVFHLLDDLFKLLVVFPGWIDKLEPPLYQCPG